MILRGTESLAARRIGLHPGGARWGLWMVVCEFLGRLFEERLPFLLW